MNHAFLIQAHNQPQLIKLIVDILNSPNHYFFIHIDKKSYKLLNSNEIKALSKMNNVKIYSFMKVNGGSSNQFLVSLHLLKKAMESNLQCEYYHLISGADLPLKNRNDFDLFFFNKDKSYIGLVSKDEALQHKQRLLIYYFRDIMNYRGNLTCKCICKILEKTQFLLLKLGIKIRSELKFELYKGSQWWSLNKKIVKYIISFCDENPSYIKRFKYTDCCDEIFFHSIIMNSKYKDQIENNNLRYIDWKPKYQNAPVPCTLTADDWVSIEKSNALFCRKIDWNVSQELIEIIKTKLL